MKEKQGKGRNSIFNNVEAKTFIYSNNLIFGFCENTFVIRKLVRKQEITECMYLIQ